MRFMTQKMLILKAGSTYSAIQKVDGDFENWIQATMGISVKDIFVMDVEESKELPNLKQISGVVITGSHDPITKKSSKQRKLCEWIKNLIAADLPILGVGYGYQLIAKALGGKIGDMSTTGPEYGTRKLTRTAQGKKDPLFALLSNSFDAQVAHFQMLVKPPKDAVVLAYSKTVPYQAIRFRPYVWGVQFHPEFNLKIMESYIDITKKLLAEDKKTSVRLRKTVRASYEAAEVLYRFAQLCQQPNSPLFL